MAENIIKEFRYRRDGTLKRVVFRRVPIQSPAPAVKSAVPETTGASSPKPGPWEPAKTIKGMESAAEELENAIREMHQSKTGAVSG